MYHNRGTPWTTLQGQKMVDNDPQKWTFAKVAKQESHHMCTYHRRTTEPQTPPQKSNHHHTRETACTCPNTSQQICFNNEYKAARTQCHLQSAKHNLVFIVPTPDNATTMGPLRLYHICSFPWLSLPHASPMLEIWTPPWLLGNY
jgi:hypothetical protein